MTELLGYVTNGVPYGCTYAIVAVGLVLTYQATGVFNFAFGAQAFASAFVFAILVQNQGLPVWAAFIVSVVIMAPLLGLALDRFLFRLIPNTNTTAKVVTGLALLVGIPTILPIIFGNQNIYNVPSVLFDPNTVYFRLFGQPINGIYLSSFLSTAVVLILLVGLMRFTNLGLQMRGAVEVGASSSWTGSTPAGWWASPGPSPACWQAWRASSSPPSTGSSSHRTTSP